MAIEFRKITDPSICVNNSWTVATYVLDVNSIIIPLCLNCIIALLTEIKEQMSEEDIKELFREIEKEE